MTPHTIDALRARLFETLDAVKNGTMPIENAKMVSEISRDIISTGKLEVDYLKVSGGGESAFLEAQPAALPAPEALPNGIVAITRHVSR